MTKKILLPLATWTVCASLTLNAQHNETLKEQALAALRGKDTSNAIQLSDQYLSRIKRKEKFSKENLAFTRQFVISSKSKAFELFYRDPQKVDAVLGKDVAEDMVMDVIGAEEISWQAFGPGVTPDWDAIERKVVEKYGLLGEEKVWGMRMIYYNEKKVWDQFGKSYLAYFRKYGARFHGGMGINNFAWDIFVNISDTAVLNEATKWVAKLVKDEPWDAASTDTYANLLYKSGRKEEGLRWQEKALELDPNNEAIKQNLEKMKKNEPTW